MYTLTIVEEYENANYHPSTNKSFTFVEADDIYISFIEKILQFAKTSNNKKCKILKIEKDKKLTNSIKLYEYISPKDIFVAIFKNKKNIIPNNLLQYLIENWKEIYKNDMSTISYINLI